MQRRMRAISTTVGIMKVPQAELTTLMAIVIQVVILEVTVGVTQVVVVTVEVMLRYGNNAVVFLALEPL